MEANARLEEEEEEGQVVNSAHANKGKFILLFLNVRHTRPCFHRQKERTVTLVSSPAQTKFTCTMLFK